MSAVRATVLGTGSVGKSALTISFLQGAFITEYDPTIEDCYSKLMRLGDQTVSLEILDTAGQEEYSALRDSYMTEGDAFMLVFSVTSRDSFDELPAFFEQLERLRDVAIREIPIVLLGNKADYDEIDWEVSKREAEAFAARMGCQFFLTSAMTQMNVNESFSAVVKRVLDNRKKEVQPETKKQMAKKCNIL